MTGETWLITGAGRGIGLALTAAQLDRGGRVLASIRTLPSQELAALGKRHGDRLTLLDFDVRDGGAIRRAADQVTGPVDVVINNAAVYGQRDTGFRNLDSSITLDTFDTNVIGALRVSDAFLRHLKMSERPRLVAVSSLMGAVSGTGKGSLDYRMSKAALNRAMLAIGEELAPLGIAVACLRPGYVRTAMTSPAAALSSEESAAGLLSVIDKLTPAARAVFVDVTGAPLDW